MSALDWSFVSIGVSGFAIGFALNNWAWMLFHKCPSCCEAISDELE